MKRRIKKIIPKRYHSVIYKTFIKPLKKDYKLSFSQSGEDMILNTILGNTKNGFYVDVGANNPTVQSNTNFFYKKGWSGINIDALPNSMKRFKKIRPRDINLEIAISDKEETLKYYMFSSSFYNTFSLELADKHKDILVGTEEIKTKKLSQVLDRYLTVNQIEFLSVDVEGLDLNVLKSNNWQKYRPKIVVIEFKIYENHLNPSKSKVGKFLLDNGYIYFCNSPTNSFFIERLFFNDRF